MKHPFADGLAGSMCRFCFMCLLATHRNERFESNQFSFEQIPWVQQLPSNKLTYLKNITMFKVNHGTNWTIAS